MMSCKQQKCCESCRSNRGRDTGNGVLTQRPGRRRSRAGAFHHPQRDFVGQKQGDGEAREKSERQWFDSGTKRRSGQQARQRRECSDERQTGMPQMKDRKHERDRNNRRQRRDRPHREYVPGYGANTDNARRKNRQRRQDNRS